MSAPGLDAIGWYIATMHSLLGHDVTARYLGVPAGDRRECLICQYEQYPGPDDPRFDAAGVPVDFGEQRDLKRQAVIRALSPERPA